MSNNQHLREAARFNQVINDLKRRPEDAARDLQVSLKVIEKLQSGEELISQELVERAVGAWPVNHSDFYIINDDTNNGVKVMRAGDSRESERVMERADKPYYAYRDTATSSVAYFRPEWIQELCEVQDDDPNNSSLQWNNGHFMHQFTYFIGPVNFYYMEDGKKKVAVMDTGDSMYITPFIPHTFTTRENEEGKKGLILALTYGDKIAGDAQKELDAIGPELAERCVLNFSSRARAFQSLLNFYQDGNSMTTEALSRYSDIEEEDLRAYKDGRRMPDDKHIKLLADALNVNHRDLLPPDGLDKRVVVQHYGGSRKWRYPKGEDSYNITELAETKNLPNSKALEIKINAGGISDFQVGLHQYGYNVGEVPITLNTEYGTHTINPDDSFYMKPNLTHSYLGEGGKLLVMRIGGRIAGEPQRELSMFDDAGVKRAIQETMPWFNKGGKN